MVACKRFKRACLAFENGDTNFRVDLSRFLEQLTPAQLRKMEGKSSAVPEKRSVGMEDKLIEPTEKEDES